MIGLDDPFWEQVKCGYGVLYNPVPALRRLEAAQTAKEESQAFVELWDNLHHQGDLGIGSYACVPQIVRIGHVRAPMTPDFFALIAVIEIERHENGNPKMSREFVDDYLHALSLIPDLIAKASPPKWDQSMIGSTCSALAASKGNRLLARAYLEMTEDNAIPFLREEIGYEP
ncbi:hypothetical protein OKA05_03325 [Luteolibacter arcticus]|uniref:Uncharacterized protein n=1 Tax=Luteolibacter arcticus TaxID=1581411 RepID=A0ABT3GD71_9BACT|nr:hypothetical protein [Luteolibacter arcticus]MCW1921569.1 hypothetical protein [Luteolibacter arcticus]